MTDTGTELGVDCAGLWVVARSFLPRIADAFLAGNATADGTAASDSAFTRYGTIAGTSSIEGSVPGPVQPAWVAARNELQRTMGETAQNIYAACDALAHIAAMYAATDDAALADFNAELKDYEANKGLPPYDKNYMPIEDPQDRPTAKMPE